MDEFELGSRKPQAFSTMGAPVLDTETPDSDGGWNAANSGYDIHGPFSKPTPAEDEHWRNHQHPVHHGHIQDEYVPRDSLYEQTSADLLEGGSTFDEGASVEEIDFNDLPREPYDYETAEKPSLRPAVYTSLEQLKGVYERCGFNHIEMKELQLKAGISTAFTDDNVQAIRKEIARMTKRAPVMSALVTRKRLLKNLEAIHSGQRPPAYDRSGEGIKKQIYKANLELYAAAVAYEATTGEIFVEDGVDYKKELEEAARNSDEFFDDQTYESLVKNPYEKPPPPLPKKEETIQLGSALKDKVPVHAPPNVALGGWNPSSMLEIRSPKKKFLPQDTSAGAHASKEFATDSLSAKFKSLKTDRLTASAMTSFYRPASAHATLSSMPSEAIDYMIAQKTERGTIRTERATHKRSHIERPKTAREWTQPRMNRTDALRRAHIRDSSTVGSTSQELALEKMRQEREEKKAAKKPGNGSCPCASKTVLGTINPLSTVKCRSCGKEGLSTTMDSMSANSLLPSEQNTGSEPLSDTLQLQSKRIAPRHVSRREVKETLHPTYREVAQKHRIDVDMKPNVVKTKKLTTTAIRKYRSDEPEGIHYSTKLRNQLIEETYKFQDLQRKWDMK